MKKNEYLTIGEMAKLANTSLKSLRIYEKIGLLKPMLINQETGYRYYSANQMNLIWLIRYCVELDIPLKRLLDFIDNDGGYDYQGILSLGRKLALEKMERIQIGLDYIDFSEKEIQLTHDRNLNEIYETRIEEKYFFLEPYDPALGDDGSIRSAAKMMAAVEKIQPPDLFETTEWGYFYEFSKESTRRYLFMELKTFIPGVKQVKRIPAGNFQCIQLESNSSRLERAPAYFTEVFAASQTVVAIEKMMTTEHIGLSDLRLEIRVLGLE